MRRCAGLITALLALVLAWGAYAASEPPPVSASAVVVADGATGEILHQRSGRSRLAIASITKLMTALVTLDHARPDDLVTVRPRAVGAGESTMLLRAGERLTVRDLLAGLLIQSANDAAYALASHVGEGSVRRFVELMNAKARALGLRDTRFVRPDGLDTPGHYSSARDVLRLARIAMRKPIVRDLVRRKRLAVAGGRVLETTNDLLRLFPPAFGVKTGFTSRAGWSEVASARRGGATVYAVLLGGPTRERRNADLERLLEWGLDQFVRLRVVDPARTYATAAIPYSDDRLRLVAAAPGVATVRLGTRLVERVVAPRMVALPVRRGDTLGRVCVDLGRTDLCRPLVAARDVGEPGLGSRVGWYAGRALDRAGGMLEGIFGG